MTESKNVAEKSKIFAVRIIKFCRFMREKKAEPALVSQILRSGTAIGANVSEAKNSQSTADFISKMNIALKEADETSYWLELFYGSEMITEDIYLSLQADCTEIIRILTAIVKTSKKKTEK